VAIKDLTNNRLLIADYAHCTTYLTLERDTIFAQDKPSSGHIEKLPYQQAVDGTAALGNQPSCSMPLTRMRFGRSASGRLVFERIVRLPKGNQGTFRCLLVEGPTRH